MVRKKERINARAILRRVIVKGFAVMIVSLSYLSADFSYYFQANILVDVSHEKFNGMVMPMNEVPKWSNLTSDEFDKVRNGISTYENFPKDKLMALPAYNPTLLAQDRTDANSDIRSTYITVYMGQYTMGAGKALENAGSHDGIDIRGLVGTPLLSIANGIVGKATYSNENGNYVVIQHNGVPIQSSTGESKPSTIFSNYLHLSRLAVTPGEVVTKGQVIGFLGNTGLTTTPHLHFQIDTDQTNIHPYWPFTWQEAKDKNLDFFDAVNAGLGQDNALRYTLNPAPLVQSLIAYVDPTRTAAKPAEVITNKTEVASSDIMETEAKPTQTITISSAVTAADNTKVKLDAVKPAENINSTTDTKKEPVQQAQTIESSSVNSSAPAVSLVISPSSNKFKPGEPITLSIKTVDSTGTLTVAPVFGDILIQDLDGKPVKQDNLTGQSFKSGILSTKISLLVGLPYNIQVGSGVVRGLVQVFPSTNQIFKDVTPANFAYDEIQDFTSKQFIKGLSDGLFHPDDQITRAQLTKVIFQAFGINTLTINTSELTGGDLNAGDWFTPFMYTAYKLNLISGYPDGSFRPNESVSQAQALKIALTAAKKLDVQTIETANPWYKPFTDKLTELKIMPFKSGKVSPDKPLTRAEAVNLIFSLKNRP